MNSSGFSDSLFLEKNAKMHSQTVKTLRKSRIANV